MKYQIERPVHDFPCHTYRNLDPNAPANKHLSFDIVAKIAELQDLLNEIIIRFDTNPRFYTKEDYEKLIDLLKNILGYLQTDLSTHPFNGIITDTSINPLDTINPGVYVTYTTGNYPNFKDINDEEINISDADITENIVVLNPVYKEAENEDEIGSWYYEKITIPVKVNQTNLNTIFRTANNSIGENYLISDVYDVYDSQDGRNLTFSGTDQVILFKINADNKWLLKNAENIYINFYRISNKKKISEKRDDFSPRKFGIKNSLFTLLDDMSTEANYGYPLGDFYIHPVKLKECQIVKNIENFEFYNLEDLETIKENVWFMLPYSTFKLFRRLFKGNESFLYNYENKDRMKLSGSTNHMFWHPKSELLANETSPIKLKVGFNVSYVDQNKIEHFSDIQPFWLKFNSNKCKLIQ